MVGTEVGRQNVHNGNATPHGGRRPVPVCVKPCYEGVRPGLEPGIPVRRPLSLVGVEPTSRRPPVVIQPPAHFSASQSLYGSNSSAPAITTINGRSVCSTSTVAPCASST